MGSRCLMADLPSFSASNSNPRSLKAPETGLTQKTRKEGSVLLSAGTMRKTCCANKTCEPRFPCHSESVFSMWESEEGSQKLSRVRPGPSVSEASP